MSPRPAERSIAVVGATGFIGSAVMRKAGTRGVPALGFTGKLPCVDQYGTASPTLPRAATLVWLATSINPALAEAQPEWVERDRRMFTTVLAALGRLSHPPAVVLMSSGGTVYDPTHQPPHDESSPTRPIGAYGAAKLALEQELLASELDCVVLRVSNVYGPGQRPVNGQGVVAHWFEAVRNGQPIRVFGDPTVTRDFIYVDDIADAVLDASDRVASLPPVINVASGTPTALGELADLVRRVTGSPADVDLLPARSFDVHDSWLANDLAAEVLGWAPQVSLPDGVSRAWDALDDTMATSPAGR